RLLVRSEPAVEIRKNKFARDAVLGRDAFLRGLRGAMASFSKLSTAEFQVTGIDTGPLSPLATLSARLRTGVRYELVGAARDFYRQQRVGQWELEWESSAG